MTRIFTLLLLLVGVQVFSVASAQAQADPDPVPSVSADPENGEYSSEELDLESRTSSDASIETKVEAGVVLGHVLALDPAGRFVFVKPLDPKLRRRTFYFDRETLFTLVEKAKRKKRKRTALIEGQRIAVRYFSRGRTALADEVFIVPEEFEPHSNYERRRIKAQPKPAAAPEAAKAGAH